MSNPNHEEGKDRGKSGGGTTQGSHEQRTGQHDQGTRPGGSNQSGRNQQGGSSGSSNKDNAGNFANDPDRARDAGRKGGQK